MASSRQRDPDRVVCPAPPLPGAHARWALLLDVDGTLLALRDHPLLVRADRTLLRLLDRLAARVGGAFALVSGRSVADLDRIFAPRMWPAAGQHGLERRDATGQLHYRVGAERQIEHAAIRLRRFVANHPGMLLEHKGASLAVHYRLAPSRAQEVARALDAVVAELGPRFEIVEGKMVREVRPVGRNKGTAIAAFLREAPFAGRCPVFVGDDRTDEFGFALVNRAGGHSIKVGPGATEATWRLPGPQAVRRWLAQVAATGR